MTEEAGPVLVEVRQDVRQGCAELFADARRWRGERAVPRLHRVVEERVGELDRERLSRLEATG
jgi:hypothetical protein